MIRARDFRESTEKLEALAFPRVRVPIGMVLLGELTECPADVLARCPFVQSKNGPGVTISASFRESARAASGAVARSSRQKLPSSERERRGRIVVLRTRSVKANGCLMDREQTLQAGYRLSPQGLGELRSSDPTLRKQCFAQAALVRVDRNVSKAEQIA